MMFLSAVNWAVVGPVIGVAAGGLLLLIVALMLRKKKPKANPGGDADRQLVDQNAKAVDILIAIVTSEEGKAALAELRDKLKFLMPSASDGAYQKDCKIKNMLDDFKIAVTRKPDDMNVISNNIRDIEIVIAERNTNV